MRCSDATLLPVSNQDQPGPEDNAPQPGPQQPPQGDAPDGGQPSGGQPPQHPGYGPPPGQPGQPGQPVPPPGYGPQGPPPGGQPPGYGQQPSQPGFPDYGTPQPFGGQPQPFGGQPQPYGSQPQQQYPGPQGYQAPPPPGYDPNSYGGQPGYDPNSYGGQPGYDPSAYGGQPGYDPNSYGGQPPFGGDPQGYSPVTFEQPLGGAQQPGYGAPPPPGYETGAMGMGGYPTGPGYPAQAGSGGGGGGNKGLLIGLGAGGLALVIAIAVVAVFALRGSGDDPDPQPTGAQPPPSSQQPQSQTPSSTGGAVTPAATGNGSLPGQPKPSIYMGYNSTNSTFDKIKERSGDSKPLTLDEVFTGDGAAPAYEGKDVRFKLTNQDLTNDCGSLVWGDKLQNDLKSAGCTQAVRGAYTSTDGKAVAIGVAFNVRSSADAGRVVDSMDPNKGAGGWVLTPKTGNDVEKLGKGGYTWGKGDGMGHYVCVTATMRLDGSRDNVIPYSVAMSDFEKFVYQRNIR